MSLRAAVVAHAHAHGHASAAPTGVYNTWPGLRRIRHLLTSCFETIKLLFRVWTKNLKKSKSPKICPNRVLMVRFDAESPQEFESDPGEARGGHLRLNNPKIRFQNFKKNIFPKTHFEATIR